MGKGGNGNSDNGDGSNGTIVTILGLIAVIAGSVIVGMAYHVFVVSLYMLAVYAALVVVGGFELLVYQIAAAAMVMHFLALAARAEDDVSAATKIGRTVSVPIYMTLVAIIISIVFRIGGVS